MADDGDPVIREIDVYLSKSLAENLYIFQYLVRPAQLTYDEVTPFSAKVKPEQKKVELELPVNIRSSNYAWSKGEQVALNVDGHNRGAEDSFFNSNVMDKTVISSSPSVVSPTRYTIGVFKEGELHLTPVHALIQLRPTFPYLDRADAKQKADLKVSEAGESSQDEGEEEDAKPVQMKFSRPESFEAKARRLASYDYLQKKRDEESWINLQYFSMHDDRAISERQMLFANKNQDASEFQMLPPEYLHNLMPPTTEQTEEKPAMPINVLSLSQLRTMPLQDQVKALLTNAKVIRFRQLLTFLSQGTDPVAVLRCLQQAAVLVQGCWVVKSDILYPKDTTSPHSGVSAEHLCRGRDYLMWKFTQTRSVTRKEIASVIKLPAEDVKDILEQMSRVRVNYGWDFAFEFDKEFTSRYPDIVQRQKMLWDAKFQSLCKQLKIAPKEIDKKAKGDQTENLKKPRTPTKSRKRTMSGRSISDHSDMEVEIIEKPIVKQEPHRDENSCGTANSNVIACLLNGPTRDESSHNNHIHYNSASSELCKELEAFVKEKLTSRYILTLSELRRLFNIKLTQCPAGHILGTGVSDKRLEQTVLDVGGLRLENQWPSNSKKEPIFALASTGDQYDQIRKVLLDMFKTSCRIKTNIFRKKVEDGVDGNSFSENECKKLLKDYCVTKGAMWYLKGTCSEDT